LTQKALWAGEKNTEFSEEQSEKRHEEDYYTKFTIKGKENRIPQKKKLGWVPKKDNGL